MSLLHVSGSKSHSQHIQQGQIAQRTMVHTSSSSMYEYYTNKQQYTKLLCWWFFLFPLSTNMNQNVLISYLPPAKKTLQSLSWIQTDIRINDLKTSKWTHIQFRYTCTDQTFGQEVYSSYQRRSVFCEAISCLFSKRNIYFYPVI